MASSNTKTKQADKKNQRELHARALEGIVTANGFFTAAVFVGINGTVAPSPSIPPHCVPGADIVQNLFLFEVLSFSFYLVSSLIAQGMKLAIAGLEATDPDQRELKYPKKEAENKRFRQMDHSCPLCHPPPAPAWGCQQQAGDDVVDCGEGGRATSLKPLGEEEKKEKLWWFRKTMKLSVALSVLGSFFLILAMVDVIQLKLGLLSCGGTAAVGAVLVLTLLGLAGLTVYVGGVVYSLRVY
ncbi:hypothetical protein BAE44_0018112 [Dichanthelium oligosanthes]|uniref:Uncharacterized protein n=1 Tax=Dichanthelium oligosanthes TaxID=888268 RepID=A0A1E5V6T7_9POAL|nr:hypothetical protein BAE44_0018112 [Dichanthelium oligosanthes]